MKSTKTRQPVANRFVELSRNENQARGIARYALDFCGGQLPGPSAAVMEKTARFHLDSVACGVAALAIRANAPMVLRQEACEFPSSVGTVCLGSSTPVHPEKSVLANCSAVRELDANGTNFGFNPRTGHQRGEFGHNDFYPVVMAGCAQAKSDGNTALRAMVCLDEIRGRLAEVFALKDHKIDHVVHGAIASTAVYGALRRATVEQIESAIGMVVAHFVPFRAIRAGHQLSDSKGASAALSSEMAVSSMRRAMRGFMGPADIFRNPQSLFCLFEPPENEDCGPFDLELATGGDDFAVMGMHFKLGLYEHQSAGAIQALINLASTSPRLVDREDHIQHVKITIYEPAFGIIGDPAKRDPRTRQSADHSMVYIIATLIRKAIEIGTASWDSLMLVPDDYNEQALFNQQTRRIMERIEFVHGGPSYDEMYPDGIPTTLEIDHQSLGNQSSGLVMYPSGHARSDDTHLGEIMRIKFERLTSLGVDEPAALFTRLANIGSATPDEIATLYSFPIRGLDD